MEDPIEAVVKQLGLKPRQTVREIVAATGLSIDEVVYALISLTSADRKVAAITAFSLAGNAAACWSRGRRATALSQVSSTVGAGGATSTGGFVSGGVLASGEGAPDGTRASRKPRYWVLCVGAFAMLVVATQRVGND